MPLSSVVVIGFFTADDDNRNDDGIHYDNNSNTDTAEHDPNDVPGSS